MADGPQIDELKELVKVSLSQTGVLGNIKAQLRAAVFKVVNDEQKPASPPKASTVMATSDSALAADLIREFLEHFELHSSLSVMVPEANLDSEYPGRAPLAVRLGLDDSSGDPLLVQLLRSSTGPSRSGEGAVNNENATPQKQSRSPSKGAQRSAQPQTPPSPPPAVAIETTYPADSPPVASPADQDPSKFVFGDSPSPAKPSAEKRSLGSLSGMPPLPGASPAKRHGMQPLPKARGASPPAAHSAEPSPSPGDVPAAAGVEALSALAGEAAPEDDDDIELTATTRRIHPRAAQPPAEDVAAARGGGGGGAVVVGADGEDDEVEEDMDFAESDGDASPAYVPSAAPARVAAAPDRHESLSESCTEVSMSDRSVDGSIALDGYDHVEHVRP